MGKSDRELPDWANRAAVEVDWNKLSKKRSAINIAKDSLNSITRRDASDDTNVDSSNVQFSGPGSRLRNIFSGRGRQEDQERKDREKAIAILNKISAVANTREAFVTEPILRQILLGENLLEIVYPDISIDTDDELCPRCNSYLTDEEVVAGWSPGDSQDYTTKCPT
eukprot:4590651-Ditylum_brightwellii.AAC.1